MESTLGVLTDFVLANRAEAEKIGLERESFAGIDAKGISQVTIAKLYAILTKTQYDSNFPMLRDASFVYTASEDGPWVQLVPDDMVQRLAAQSDADLVAVSEAWSDTDEFLSEYSRWRKADLHGLLQQLRELSKRAADENKVLFMWTCL